MKKYLKYILALLCIIFSIILIVSIIKIGVLPNKYLFMIVGGILLLLLIIVFLLCYPKRWMMILGTVLGIVSLIGNSIGIYYLYQTDYFLTQAFSGKVIETTNYCIIALKDTDRKIPDDSKIIYYENLYQKDKILDLLNNNYHFTFEEYSSLNDMIDAVLNQKEKYLLVETSSYHILETFDSRIDENLMILNTYSIKSEKKTKQINENSTNIYLLGNDYKGLNDFNMIVTINQNKRKILLTSMSRDLRIPVHGYEGQEDNLEYMAPLGIETSIASLEDYFDIKIDYYVHFDVHSLVKVVDTIGGITYCSDYEYQSTTKIYDNKYGKSFYVIKGCQEVDGWKALAIARERKKIPGSDVARQDNCRKILLAIFDKIKSTDTLKNYQNLLEVLADSYETTIPKEYIQKMAKEVLKQDSKWTIEENAVWGEDTIGMVHLGTVRDYTMIPDEKSVEDAKKKMKDLGR